VRENLILILVFNVLDMYSLLSLFSRSIRGSLHITHTCTCIGLWPPVNDSYSFPNMVSER
jgi:hypothetical protein